MLALPFHHIGCAVRDLSRSLETYAATLGRRRCSPVIEVASQATRVCFVELGPGHYLELVEGGGPSSPVERFVKTGFYHLCFLVDDLAATVAGLVARRCHPLRPFESEAFGGHRCQFLMTPDGHLVELAEISPPAFAALFDAAARTLEPAES